jgi:hypothetical protein
MNADPSLSHAWSAIRAVLQHELTFYDIKEVVGLGGLDLSLLSNLVQRAGGGASKGQLMTAIDGCFSQLPSIQKKAFLSFVAEQLLTRRPESNERLAEYLSRFGWGIADAVLVPLAVVDPTEIKELSEAPRHDLTKAVQRLRDGDISGALSAACGAVDTCTATVYLQHQLGSPGESSFQERCKRSLEAIGVMQSLESQLESIGWQHDRIKPLQSNFQGALNQGAYVMQTLRANMGDVHGTKPIFKPLVLDCIKWAELMVRTIEGRWNDA